MSWHPDILLVDGNNLFSRAFFVAKAQGPKIKNAAGKELGGVFKFLQMVKTLHNTYYKSSGKALRYVYVFDGGNAEREKLYPEYKAHREEHPEDFIPQLSVCMLLLAAMGLPTVRILGHEADDVINTILHSFTGEEPVGIVTRDKDLMQLVKGNTRVIDTQTSTVYDASNVVEKFKVSPHALQMYLAVMGDKADSIPGIKGYGPVRAQYIAQRYPTLQVLFAKLDEDGLDDIEEPGWFWDLHHKRDEVELSYKLTQLRSVPEALNVKPAPMRNAGIAYLGNVIHPIKLEVSTDTDKYVFISNVGIDYGWPDKR